ncbi:MAG: type II secretion system protein GspE [Planctomycetota bacterium]|nr:MAG: type II secretion system protein GspE [Planctomycetota bacterium]
MALSPSEELRDQLLAVGAIPPAQIQEFEAEARESDTDLETVIRKRRVLSETNLHALRAMRLGAPYCNLSDFIPRLQNAELIDEALARRHTMFPLFVLDGMITMVVEDPNDLAGIDQVRRLTKQEVDVCVGSRSEIVGLIERAYGASRYLEQSSVADSLLEVAEAVDGDETRPVIRLVDDLVNEALRQSASDIHIEPGEKDLRIRIRVDGVLREVAAPPLGLHRALVSRIKVISKLDISRTRSPQDGAFQYRNGETEVMIRVSVLPSVYGESVVMRLLRNASDAIGLHDLGMEPDMFERFKGIITNAHGMILVSGPTGSGKSTTLYAVMKAITSPQKNIVTIEDPVEYRTSRIRQVQVNPEADLTFASGLRSILRQDPDVIMVGEIRDRETAQIAVQSALTGHLLLSTVHTNDAIGSIARLRDLGVPEFLISSSLLAVLAQRLCRRICPDCKAPDDPPEYMLSALGLTAGNLDFQPMRGKGCRRCIGSGYLGRCGIYELFEVTEEFSAMIVRLEPTETIRAAARSKGIHFLVDDGIAKVRAGITSVEEVARVAGRC